MVGLSIKSSVFIRPFIFLSQWRSLPLYELISYVLMFASVPMLAYGVKSYNGEILIIIILTVLTLYCGFFASLIWNDITDVDIDAIAHPNRPIPSGKIKIKKFFMIALIFSALTFIFAYLISFFSLFLVGIAALFVAFHNKYFKRKFKFPAYSEIFGPIQWIVFVLFGFLVIWTVLPQSSEILVNISFFGSISTSGKAIQLMILLVLFTYFADTSHDISEGLHDAYADRLHKVKTYTTTFGKKKAVMISFIMFVISGIIGVLLFFQSILSPFFLCLFLVLFVYTLYYPLQLLKSNKRKTEEKGLFIGRKLYNYFLFTFAIIFIDLVIQIMFYSYSVF